MIDQERVREMMKLAAYEEHEGKQYRQVSSCYRWDFVVRHLLKSFFSATIAFGILLVLWGVCSLEELVKEMGNGELVSFGVGIFVRYLVFLAAYLIITGIYANIFYTEGTGYMRRYYRRLKRLSSLYEEQERRTAPTQH